MEQGKVETNSWLGHLKSLYNRENYDMEAGNHCRKQDSLTWRSLVDI